MITFGRVLLCSLRFHWRSHLGVVLGAAVGSAALIGALAVGDSVRASLVARALARLGGVDVVLSSGDRLFGADLVERLASGNGAPHEGESEPVRAATLVVRGTAALQDGAARAHDVQIVGWTAPLQSLAPEGGHRVGGEIAAGRVRINEAMAEQLGVGAGATIVLRFAKPTAVSQDVVLNPRSEASAALRLVVDAVVGTGDFGEFSLRSGQRRALNAFVNPSELSRACGVTNRANLLLVGTDGRAGKVESVGGRAEVRKQPTKNAVPALSGNGGSTSAAGIEVVEGLLEAGWRLEDAEIELRTVIVPAESEAQGALPPMIEVATRRIFLDTPVGPAALTPGTRAGEKGDAAGAWSHGIPVVTYLANAIRSGDRLTPYSMVTAVGPPWTPADLGDDEIVVTDWLARDLGVKVGDAIELVYFDPEAGARLVERTNAFTVRTVVAMQGRYADRSLMPEFPGLAKAESTSEWDAGFPLVHPIREQDEAYWKEHRGTPKALVSLNAGRRMWANRFGEYTAIRFPVPADQEPSAFRQVVQANLRSNLRAADVGLVFRPVREEGLRAATSGQDFGQLFLGFSLFLVVAALLLMGLLFQFGLEQRLPEVGTLLALGLRRRAVRGMWLAEGVVLAALGGTMGVLGGTGYAKAMIGGLTSAWRDAVAGTSLAFHVTGATLGVGLAASVTVCALTLAWTMRRQFRRPARVLLAGEAMALGGGDRSRGGWIGGMALAVALGLVGWAIAASETRNPGTFFGAGSLLLIAGLAFVSAGLSGRSGRGWGQGEPHLSTRGLAVRGTARRRSRSLATVGLLACGTFLIAAIGAFRMDAGVGATRRDSGTGGFAWIGETSLPVVLDLDTAAGLEAFGLGTNDVAGTRFVPFRVREGDDASCLNLDRAQRPRLLGVRPQELAGRGAFRFASLAKGVTNGWLALTGTAPESGERGVTPEIPAIGDAASIQWALGRRVGDAIEMTDERGRPFRLRLVGGLANSIFQGSLVVEEEAFLRLFPGDSGYRWYLIDAEAERLSAVGPRLSRAMADVGLELTPATRRLAEFNAVQNTYLTTFQILGGLGLLLGSAGLGVVVLRNVLERRGELALLTAVGFRRRALVGLVLGEHAVLLALGLGIGLVSAAVAVLPALWAPTVELPVRSLGLTLGGAALLGLLTAWLATWTSLRGHLLSALRGE